MNSAEFRTGKILREAGAASWAHAASWVALTVLVQSPIIVRVAVSLLHPMQAHWAPAAISAAVTGAFLVIGQAVVTGAMVAHLCRRQAKVRELLHLALHLPAPLVRLAVGCGVAGVLLSLIPPPMGAYAFLGFAIVAYFYCSVAVPVILIEHAGVMQALRRAVSLTSVHGAELISLHVRVFMLWLVILVPVMLGVNALVSPAESGLIVEAVLAVLATLSAAVVGTASYRELRLTRDGVAIENIPSMPGTAIFTPIARERLAARREPGSAASPGEREHIGARRALRQVSAPGVAEHGR